MIVYIAGKISGDPEYKDKFEDTKLRISQAIRYAGGVPGVHEVKTEPVVLNPAELPAGMKPRDYMRICFAMIDCADLVVFQPEWTDSPGAQLELQHCKYTGKPYITLPHSWRMQ